MKTFKTIAAALGLVVPLALAGTRHPPRTRSSW